MQALECILFLSLWEKLPLMLALEPVPWTAPRYNELLLLMLLLLLYLHQSNLQNNYVFQLIKQTNYLLNGHNISKQLPINTRLTSENRHILHFTRYTTTPSMNPLTALIALNQSLFISYTWYISRANIISIHIQNLTQKWKKEKAKWCGNVISWWIKICRTLRNWSRMPRTDKHGAPLVMKLWWRLNTTV